jgi:hypothetical protein
LDFPSSATDKTTIGGDGKFRSYLENIDLRTIQRDWNLGGFYMSISLVRYGCLNFTETLWGGIPSEFVHACAGAKEKKTSVHA